MFRRIEHLNPDCIEKRSLGHPQRTTVLSALPSLTNNTMNVGFVNSSPKCHSRFGLGAAVRRVWCERQVRADFVEKLRISDVVIFRKEPMIAKSQMRFSMRRSELPHERQKSNLAEPLASKSWSRCTGKKFTEFVKNGVFQQYPPESSAIWQDQD